jgi:stage II sporulation protein D
MVVRTFRWCLFLVLSLGLIAAGCAASPRAATVPRSGGRVVLPGTIEVRSGGRIVSVDLEEYVIDTILAEVSPLNEPDDVVAGVFEVQAVIARSYAVSQIGRHRSEGFDVCDSTHCQLYQPARRRTSRFLAAAKLAAEQTRSIVLAYDGQAIEALFHADCGGATASADAVWGGSPVPYLKMSLDDLPEPTHRPWRVTAKAEQLRAALNEDPRTSVGRRLESITVAARDASGRAAGLSIRGEKSYTVRGDVRRAVLNRGLGERSVMSTMFTIERRGNDYIFSGTGFGHGVGLCQRGAATRLRRGDSVAGVLQAYYAGTRPVRGTSQ